MLYLRNIHYRWRLICAQVILTSLITRLLAGVVALAIASLMASGAISQPLPPQADTSSAPSMPSSQAQINRTAPSDLSVDSGAFTDAGCISDGSALNCSSIGLDSQFNCSMIYNASDALGGLSPKLPIAECIVYDYSGGYSQDEGVIQEGCMLPSYVKYIVLDDGEFRLIGTRDEFVSLFAPVDTPEEALSFAVALTGSSPIYDTAPPEGYFPVASEIKPTYVEESDGGFKVHLFDMDICGCGTHPYYAVDYLVTREGNVTEISRQEAFNSSMQVCID